MWELLLLVLHGGVQKFTTTKKKKKENETKASLRYTFCHTHWFVRSLSEHENNMHLITRLRWCWNRLNEKDVGRIIQTENSYLTILISSITWTLPSLISNAMLYFLLSSFSSVSSSPFSNRMEIEWARTTWWQAKLTWPSFFFPHS